MYDHDPGCAHPSLIDLATRRAQHVAERRAAEPIQLHCRRPKWEPVTVTDPEAALRSTIAQATHKPTDFSTAPAPKPSTDARVADMSHGIGKALEDAEQAGYVRGHQDGLVAAVQCERIDWIAVGWITGALSMLLIQALPAILNGIDQALGWLL